METQITLSEEAFIALFRPKKNELNYDTSYDFGAGGTMYETYGDEHDHVIAQNPAHIWTICSDEGNGDYITSGYHFADRLGYIISDHPVPAGIKIIIEIPNSDSDDNLYHVADQFIDRVREVIGYTEFASSHQCLDLEYHLYQMIGEACGLMVATNEDGTMADISELREHMALLEKSFARIEAECEEFKAAMEGDNA